MARSAGMVSALTLVSRILGLAREQAFAALLGAGHHADAFLIAFRIPNLLRDLFAEGALSAALVPTYARAVKEQGREAAYRLANRLVSVLLVILAVVVLLGFVFTAPIVNALAPGFAAVADKTEGTILLTRIMLPFLPLVSIAAVAMGMLNAESRFRAPAFAPALFNVVAIAGGILFWAAGFTVVEAVAGWAVATVVGGAAQLGVQLPSLWKRGYRFRWEWEPTDPGLARIAKLIGPATLGLAAVQLNIFISSHFASFEPHAVSWLQYAFRILYLPIGLFGVAVATIAATGFAERAASGDLEGVRETVRRALRSLGFLTIPSTIGLVVLAVPVVTLLYQRGAFTPEDTRATATALSYYAVGLVAYTGVKILAPAFYALGAARVPLLASVLSVAANLLVITSLYDALRFRSVALGVAIGAIVNLGVLALFFERRVGGLLGKGLIRSLASMCLASVPMTLVAWSSARYLESAFPAADLLPHLIIVLVPVALGAGTYFLFSRLLRIPEVDALSAVFERRRKIT